MVRTWVVGALGLMMVMSAPAAWACACRSGAICHCGTACTCAGADHGSGESSGNTTETMTMTSPTEQIVAAALSSPQTVHVPVFAGFFDADVTIHVGDTVQWDWVFPLFHDITTVNGSAESFDSGILTDTYSHTFVRPETIVYYCRIHGFDNFDGTATGMTATVTVLPVPEPTEIAILAVAAVALTSGRRRRRRAHQGPSPSVCDRQTRWLVIVDSPR